MKKGKYLIEYDCYVAENGNITQNDKEIKPYLNGGYMTVKLKINGLKVMRVHRLVALAFIPNPDNKPCVDHIDGNKLNNHVNNLEWCTRSENIKHSYDKKLRIKSSEESSKLTTKDINEIRKLYSSGDYLQKDLGIKFGINQQQISKIINYKQWK